MPEPERSIEELVADATDIEWKLGFNAGLESVSACDGFFEVGDPSAAKATLLRAVARLREDLNGSRHIHGLTLGVQNRLREENERLRGERDEARAKLAGTLTLLRLVREHEKPHAPSPYDAGHRPPHPEGRGP